MDTIKNLITGYFNDLWPVIIIITVIASSLRIAYYIKSNQKFCFYKELSMLLFILYVICLFEIVTLQDNNYGLSNFMPFKEMFRYEFGSRLFIKNIIGNILLFLPYGYFATDYIKSKKALPICFLTMLVSLTIEVVQLNIGRTFDIDDVILNTVGGLCGFYLYRLMDSISKKLPKFFKTDGFINFIVIIVLIFAIIYLFDWNVVNWLNN